MRRALPIALALAATLANTTARAQSDDWWARDKALHFGASATLAAGGYGAAALLSDCRTTRLVAGGALALGLGTAKEIADRYTGGDPSMKDFTWDVIGTATGLLVAWTVDRLLEGPIRKQVHNGLGDRVPSGGLVPREAGRGIDLEANPAALGRDPQVDPGDEQTHFPGQQHQTLADLLGQRAWPQLRRPILGPRVAIVDGARPDAASEPARTDDVHPDVQPGYVRLQLHRPESHPQQPRFVVDVQRSHDAAYAAQ